MKHEVIVFTDGACSGNPGPGGWGAVLLKNGTEIFEYGAGFDQTTNNKMELSSVIFILQKLKNFTGKIHIFTDSTYVINGATKWMWGWARNNWLNAEKNEISNKDLWQEMYRLIPPLKSQITWNYVRGHTGVVGNERCDEIAVAFSKGDSPYLYQTDYTSYPHKILPLPKPEPLPEAKFNGAAKSKDEKNYYISVVNGVLSKHTTWSDCERVVKGRPGAKFKKVKNEQEENIFLESIHFKK